jgi:hypothetical protein
MAIIELPSGERVMLLDEHVIGRSSRCDTQLDDPDISSRHVLVRFHDDGWWLRDLGSTNGTHLGNSPVTAGQEVRWDPSADLTMGGTSLRLLDASPPTPGVLELGSGRFIPGEPSLCLIERGDQTLASIHLEHGTQWWLEQGNEAKPIADGDTFHCDGHTYRFFSGGEHRRTAQQRAERSIRQLHLDFTVSLDEEHVRLVATLDGQRLDLGARTHHYTLLTLARCRQQDATDPDLPESSRGWITTDQLTRQLGSSETKLSVEICRIRQQLSKHGLSDAADIIERRRGSGQLRIGVGDFTITRA